MESLITELDVLATKLGEEEAKRNHNYVEVEDYEASTRKTTENNQEKLSGTYNFIQNPNEKVPKATTRIKWQGNKLNFKKDLKHKLFLSFKSVKHNENEK